MAVRHARLENFHPSHATSLYSPYSSMPVTRNAHTSNTHNIHLPARLACTFEGCDRTFTSKSGLTRHLRASHQPTGTPSSPLMALVAGSNCHPSPSAPSVASSNRPSLPPDCQSLRCPFPECAYPVKSRVGLTLHTRTFHLHSDEPASPGRHPLPTSPDQTEDGGNHNVVCIIPTQLFDLLMTWTGSAHASRKYYRDV